MKVSQSRIKTWRRCRRAYHNKYVLGLRKKVSARPLKFGSFIHRMSEHHISGKSWKRAIRELKPEDHKLFECEREHYGDIIQDASDIMTDYVDYYRDDDVRYVRHKGQRAEHEIEMKITRTIKAVAIIDFIAHTDGLFWLGDHKTFTNMMDEEDMWRNLQSTLYHRAWEETGSNIKLEGTMWDHICSKPPSVPKLTKSGALSKAAIVTLPSTVRRFQRDNAISDDDISELLEVAFDCRKRYFVRSFMSRQKKVEQMLFEDFVETAKDIEKNHGKEKARNIGRDCSWCEFKPLCHARLLDLDYGFIKRSQYIVDEKRRDELHEKSND